jgi:uncharacterized protein (DUF1501 family)
VVYLKKRDMTTRREFLQKSAFATVGTMLIPNFLKGFEQQAMAQAQRQGKILVIIQLSGGNDGLNTVVPFRNDIYYRERPTISIKQDKVLKLTDDIGLNPAMQALQGLYDDGKMQIINNVGYPNPDRSHFRSMDIWQTASSSDEYLKSGWLGRYLDAQCSGKCEPHAAIEVDDSLSLAMKGSKVKGMAVQNPQQLYRQTQNPFLDKLAKVNHEEFDNVNYLYKTLSETISSADYIYEKSKVYQSKANYPQTDLGKRMKTISELINSGVQTQVYYASHGSFDTHVNQLNQQERLLKQYADAMNIFMQDLKENGRMDDVLVMTFSEFGRRVKQNGSGGTDHGTASNVFVMGGKLKTDKTLMQAPDLQSLDEGDLKYKVDFRNIYSTVLDKWLETDSVAVLGKKFEGLGFV